MMSEARYVRRDVGGEVRRRPVMKGAKHNDE